ncbi:MAG: hypothetical protein V4671_05400, partial [Armatimonadota bacterium]
GQLENTPVELPNPKDTEDEQIVGEFLGDQPRAETWRSYKEVLAVRLKEALESRDAAAPDSLQYLNLDKKVRELREQVRVLAEEEAITQFVEDSVRATMTRPQSFHAGDESDDEGYG